MENKEIIHLAYEYADSFTSGFIFSEDNLIDFAKAILNYSAAIKPQPFYKDKFTEDYIKELTSSTHYEVQQ